MLSPTDFGGCLETGFYANQYGQVTRYGDQTGYNRNGIDPLSGNTFLLNNVEQTGLQLNQAWVYVERKVNTQRGFDFGYRADLMYGTDARFQQSNGDRTFDWSARDGDYYTAIPNLYVEGGYKNVRVKFGKFESPLGYEAMYAPDRFFYSETYSFAAAANTHTGVYAEWDVNDRVTVSGGWVTGVDKTFTGGDNAFLGGIDFKLTDKASLGYFFLAGQDDNDGRQNYYQHMFLFQWNPVKRWNYAFEWTLVDGDMFGNLYGINQELIYSINDRWAVGLRGEWMRDNNWQADMYEFTLGLNWTPTKWFLLRPEIRYDNVDGPADFRPFNGTRNGEVSQWSGGCSAIVKF